MPPSPKYSDPDAIARIADLTLRSRRLVEGAISGMHRSPFHGFNIEFAAYREYTPGDDLRRLDWRVFARSDRHYIKQYEEESNVRVTFMSWMPCRLDEVQGLKPPLSKFDYASTLVVALSMLLTRQQDPVGLVVFDEAATTILPPLATQSQVANDRRACSCIAQPKRAKTEPGRIAPLGDRPSWQRRRSLLVIVSDLFTDLDAGLRRPQPPAVPRGHEVLMMQVLDRVCSCDLPSTGRPSSTISKVTRSCSPSPGRSGGRTARPWTSSSKACGRNAATAATITCAS